MSSIQVATDDSINVAVPRPPFPPFTRETAIQKVRLAEDGWNSRDAEKWPWPIRQIHAGETARSLPTVVRRLLPCLNASGHENLITGLSRSCGFTTEIALPFASHMSGTTTRRIGFALMEMRTGNLMTMD